MLNNCHMCNKIILPFTLSPLDGSVHKKCHFEKLCSIMESEDREYAAEMTLELEGIGILLEVLKYRGDL